MSFEKFEHFLFDNKIGVTFDSLVNIQKIILRFHSKDGFKHVDFIDNVNLEGINIEKLTLPFIWTNLTNSVEHKRIIKNLKRALHKYYGSDMGVVEPSIREETLDAAKKCVMGDREQDYGTPESNFATIASFWSDYLDMDISAQQVADMMILMKISRIKNGGGTGDSYVDIAGYAACGNEILSKAHK